MSREDVLQFVNSREWERKFSLEGENFIIFPNYFKQPQNTLEIDTQINTNSLHWWFWESCFINELGFSESINKKLKKHSVTFNVFVRASVAKINMDVITSRFPNYGQYLKRIGKEYETTNVDTLMQLNSSKQIENAVMAIEILKLKLHKELTQFPQLSGFIGNMSSSGSSSELTISELPEIITFVEKPKIPQITRGMSALDVRNITDVIDDLSRSRDDQELPQKTTFLEKISPHLSRKHKKRK